MTIENEFTILLKGGHRNSLGNTEKVVSIILKDLRKTILLYDCYKSNDEVVRLRVSSCFNRIFKQQPPVFDEYIDKFLSRVANINQASAKWTVAKIITENTNRMSKVQKAKAKIILLDFLENQKDWIVLNSSMIALSKLYLGDGKSDEILKSKISPLLRKLTYDKRNSVKSKSKKVASDFSINLI